MVSVFGRVIRVEDVNRLIAFIPKGHTHIRILLELNDGSLIVFQQALIDALIRAYVSVSLHPTKYAVELIKKRLDEKIRKHGFVKLQLVESSQNEDEVLEFAEKIYSKILNK